MDREKKREYARQHYWKNRHRYNCNDKSPEERRIIFRRRSLKRYYNLTLEQYDEMLKEQGSVCQICKDKSTKTLHVDHNHATGKIRGLLCAKCNHAIGLLKDSVSILQNAIKYLNN